MSSIGYLKQRGRLVYNTGRKKIGVKFGISFTKTFLNHVRKVLDGIIPEHPEINVIRRVFYRDNVYNLESRRWLRRRVHFTNRGNLRSASAKKYQVDDVFPKLRITPKIGEITKTLKFVNAEKLVIGDDEKKDMINTKFLRFKNEITGLIKGTNPTDALRISMIINSATYKDINIITNPITTSKYFKIPVFGGTAKQKKEDISKWSGNTLMNWIYGRLSGKLNAILDQEKLRLDVNSLLVNGGEVGSGIELEDLDNLSLELQVGLVKDAVKIGEADDLKTFELNQMFAEGERNCVIKCIEEQMTEKQRNKKIKKLEWLNKKFEKGARYEDLELIAKKLSINIKVMDINKNVKYQTKERKKHKIIELINAQYNHVETFEHPLFEAMRYKEVVIKTTNEIIDCVEDKKHPLYKVPKILKERGEKVIFNDEVWMTKEKEDESVAIDAFFENYSANEYLSTNNMDLYNHCNNSIHHPVFITIL